MNRSCHIICEIFQFNPLYEPALVLWTGQMLRAFIIFGSIFFALSNAFGSGSGGGGGNAIEYVDLGSGMLQQLKEVIT